MRVGIALGVGLVCLACVGVVAANQPPLASAGLDQEARANTTVYLDAGGSLDPDGSIASYEWTIVRPDGNTTTPECSSCAKTWFVPREVGRYNVTATVTDEDGASQSDTLYVAVSAPLALPSSPSSGGGGVGGGGSYASSTGLGGTWSAVVNTGEELVLSSPRGTDFKLQTPLGTIHIESSVLERVREPDGDIPLDDVDHRFYAMGLTDEMIRDVTADTPSEGNNCKSGRGNCATFIPDSEQMTEETRRNMGLYSGYKSNSETETSVNSPTRTTARKSIEGALSTLSSSVNAIIDGNNNDDNDSTGDDEDSSSSAAPISNVIDQVTGGDDSAASNSGSDGSDTDTTSSYENDGFGSPVP